MTFSATLVTNIIIPLLSLSGLLGGLLLSYLAREELAEGKRYFVMSYRILFILLSLVVAYFISSSRFSSYSSSLTFSISIIFLFLAIILLLLDLRKCYPVLFLFQYLFFLTGYFVAGKQIIIAVIIFINGLPLGTLLQMKDE